MLSLYRLLLRLYPKSCRADYGGEMVLVFQQAQAQARQKSLAARARFYWREIQGLLANAIGEHFYVCVESCSPPASLTCSFIPRSFTMHSEFRFPKSATILMSLILGEVLSPSKKQRSLSIPLRIMACCLRHIPRPSLFSERSPCSSPWCTRELSPCGQFCSCCGVRGCTVFRHWIR